MAGSGKKHDNCELCACMRKECAGGGANVCGATEYEAHACVRASAHLMSASDTSAPCVPTLTCFPLPFFRLFFLARRCHFGSQRLGSGSSPGTAFLGILPAMQPKPCNKTIIKNGDTQNEETENKKKEARGVAGNRQDAHAHTHTRTHAVSM